MSDSKSNSSSKSFNFESSPEEMVIQSSNNSMSSMVDSKSQGSKSVSPKEDEFRFSSLSESSESSLPSREKSIPQAALSGPRAETFDSKVFDSSDVSETSMKSEKSESAIEIPPPIAVSSAVTETSQSPQESAQESAVAAPSALTETSQSPQESAVAAPSPQESAQESAVAAPSALTETSQSLQESAKKSSEESAVSPSLMKSVVDSKMFDSSIESDASEEPESLAKTPKKVDAVPIEPGKILPDAVSVKATPVKSKTLEKPDIIPLTGKKCPNGFRQPSKKDGTCKKKKKIIKISKKQIKKLKLQGIIKKTESDEKKESIELEEPEMLDKSSCEKLISDLNGVINKLTLEEKKYNEILRCISDKNRENISPELNFLYPLLDDPNFNKKISLKKEFYDAKYIPKTDEEYENIEQIANKLCNEREFELSAHQKFVRNFLSSHTPYNSLLLFHGVGTGKTCSAISVCEEMRLYTKQLKNKKKIIVVATPNVQENFKLQLFDERKLKEIDGYWNIKSCTGNTFIKEINPMHMKGLSRDKVIKQIKKIIRNSYLFIGYTAFANMIENIMKNVTIDDLESEEKKKRGLKLIKKEFSNRMIVIDEVQNIRNVEGISKNTTDFLIKAVKYTTNTKLLLLSATPMYNSPREIVWLLKLMNCNDDRFVIDEKEVFDKDDNLLVVDGREVGKEILIRNSTGYVSYVRGENPFAFPFRLYPNDFNSPHSIKKLQYDSGNNWYPKRQLNGKTIVEPINVLDIFITKLGPYQQKAYDFLLNELKKNPKKNLNNPNKGLQLSVLDSLTQVLNVSYPLLKDDNWRKGDMSDLYGLKGIENNFYFHPKKKNNFHYKREVLEKHGQIFSPSEVSKYSGKIKNICDCIKKSKGIVILFSQFIYGGCVPIALILEEMGFKRYNHEKSLFKEEHLKTVEPLNALTMKHRDEGDFKQAHYAMITGDKNFSPDNKLELIAATNENNTNGEIIKVIIISRAGSEGLDFKNIRQVHILEPWYNFNRTEQVIGRGVRNLSHCKLPFKERNVEIYLYGSELENQDEEASDLFLYRLAEEKAKKIGVISRLLKQNAIDCKLNQSYNMINYDKNIELITSSNKTINYKIKDKPYSGICDFMEDCECMCLPDNTEIDENDVNKDTYNESFIMMNLDVIFNRIKQLFKEEYVYEEKELIARINALKSYPIEQIYSALTQLINDKNEFISDMLDRIGRLINIDNYYLFQPLEIEDPNISLFERKVPLDYKRRKISFKIPSEIKSDSILMEKDEEIVAPPIATVNIPKPPEEKVRVEEEEEIILPNKEKFISILNKLRNDYYECTNYKQIKKLTSATKKLWVNNCAWTIYNLENHNKEIPHESLSKLALDHLLDILEYNEKVELIKNISFKIESNKENLKILSKKYDSSFLLQINAYFDKFVIEDDDNVVIPLVKSEEKSNKVNKTLMFIVLKSDGIEEMSRIPSLNIKRNLDSIKLTDDEIKKLKVGGFNIGFMIYDKRYKVQFKTKKVNTKNKGASCERGATKSMLISKINILLPKKSEEKSEEKSEQKEKLYEKYYMDPNANKRNSKIIKIYNKSGINIIQRDFEGSEIPINTTQLCIEIEMIHRYYDSKKLNSQKWFFNELEWYMNENLLN